MGARIGELEILDMVAAGGMAEVYRARLHDRLIAIKKILPQFTRDTDLVQMFVDEARIASLLRHPNIITVHDLLVSDGGEFFIAMEYADGKDLSDATYAASLKGLRLTPPIATHVAREVLRALEYAHAARDRDGRGMNLIHRDISPHNVMMGFDGWVKLTDFGIAKVAHSGHHTMAGVVKGKFGYMSPEQARGKKIDGRSDLYNVGILLYEMLTGERLFTGASDISTLDKMRAAEVPALPAALRCPPDLEAVIRRVLSKYPDDRFPDATAFLGALADVATHNNFRSGTPEVTRMIRDLFQGQRLGEPPPPSRRGLVPVSSAIFKNVADSPLAPPAKPSSRPGVVVAGKGVTRLDGDGRVDTGPRGAIRSTLPAIPVAPAANVVERTRFDEAPPPRRTASSSSVAAAAPAIVTKASVQALPAVRPRSASGNVPAAPPSVVEAPEPLAVPAAPPPPPPPPETPPPTPVDAPPNEDDAARRKREALERIRAKKAAKAAGLPPPEFPAPAPAPPPVDDAPPPAEDERARKKREALERIKAKKAAKAAAAVEGAVDAGPAPDAPAVEVAAPPADEEWRTRADAPASAPQPERAGKVLAAPLPTYQGDARPLARRGAWIIGEPAISPAQQGEGRSRLVRALLPATIRRRAAVLFVASLVGFYVAAAQRPQVLVKVLGRHASVFLAGVTDAPQPAAGTTALTIRTSPPGARMWLDGDPLEGESPRTLTLRLEPGSHRLSAMKGKTRREVAFKVAEGQNAVVVHVPIQPDGEVEVGTWEPGAQVFLDGRLVGAAPRRLTDLGRDRVRHVLIRVGDRVLADEVLAPDRPARVFLGPPEGTRGDAQVVVLSQPPALLAVDGRALTRMTGVDPLPLPPGRHTLSLTIPALGITRELVVDASARSARRYHVDLWE